MLRALAPKLCAMITIYDTLRRRDTGAFIHRAQVHFARTARTAPPTIAALVQTHTHTPLLILQILRTLYVIFVYSEYATASYE